MAIRDLGIVEPGSTLYIPFHTFDSNDPSASVTLTGLAVTDIEIYKDGSVTQRASDNGYTLLDTDGIDFDGITGIHGLSISLADNSTAGFYAAGSQYWVVISSVTVDAATVNFVLCTFRIGYPAAILNTTIASLSSQTSFTLTNGPAEDDALNGSIVLIHDVASAVQKGYAVILDYTGSTKTVTLLAGTTFTAAATDNISVFPPVNVSHLNAVSASPVTTIKAVQGLAVDGVITTATNVTTVNGLAANVITAASIATGAIDADAIADNAIDAGALAADCITAAKIANGAIDAATFAADMGAEILSYLVDDATRIDASALNTATVTTIPDILVDTAEIGAAGAGLTNINLPNQTMDIVGNITGNLSGSVGSVTGAVGSVTGNVGGNVTGTIGGLTAAALKDFFDTDSTTTYASAVAGSVVKEIADNAGGSALTADAIADEVETRFPSNFAALAITAGGIVSADLQTIKTQTVTCAAGVTVGAFVGQGTAAIGVNASGHVSRVVLTDTLTTYTGNTPQTGDAYAVVNHGTHGNAAIKTQTAAIETDTNELQTDWANGGRLDLLIDATKAQTDKLTFNGSNHIYCDVRSLVGQASILDTDRFPGL
jgi:hypothetical protein